MKKKIIGIDLGTTNSCVSIVEGGQPKVISNAEGARTTPSVVTIENDGKSLVGIMAKRQSGFKPNSTIIANKRLMGLSYEEAEKATQTHQPLFKMTRHNNGGVGIVIGNKTYTPQEISAKILSKLKVDTESYLGESVTEAVITVPAYFNDAQRQATKDAAEIAGLKVARIINEPTAAAVAYGLDKQNAEETIVVYDLGGGTFDVSILKISEGVIETLSTHGDGWLGGEDIDNSIVQDIIDDFKSKNGVDLSKDIGALQRIKESAEKAKIELSSMQETEINLPYVTVDPVTGPKHLYYKLTKPKLNLLSEKLRKKTFASCDTALKNANLNASEIRKVVLVGGQTRDPEIQADVAKYFPNAKIEKGVNPDEVVAMGAAIQGAVLVGDVQGVVLLDVTPLSLGIETYGGVMTKMIEANTTIPTSKSQVFSTAADNQSSVEIRVFQGERSMANDNKLLGSFNLSDIPAAPKGVPQIEVTFNIDANGILNVAAKDKGTNKEQKITITNSSGLSKEEIEKLKKDAELNAEQDKKRMELVEVRNRAESLIYDAEKVIKENKEKLLPENINNLETKIKELKDIYNTEENKEIIENTIQVLQNEMITIQNELQKINSNNNSENTEGN